MSLATRKSNVQEDLKARAIHFSLLSSFSTTLFPIQ